MLHNSSPVSSDSTSKSSDCERSNSKEFYDDMIYGNPSFMKSPRKMGNLRTFLFINNQPIIVIGFNRSNLYSITNSILCNNIAINFECLILVSLLCNITKSILLVYYM